MAHTEENRHGAARGKAGTVGRQSGWPIQHKMADGSNEIKLLQHPSKMPDSPIVLQPFTLPQEPRTRFLETPSKTIGLSRSGKAHGRHRKPQGCPGRPQQCMRGRADNMSRQGGGSEGLRGRKRRPLGGWERPREAVNHMHCPERGSGRPAGLQSRVYAPPRRAFGNFGKPEEGPGEA